MKNVTIGILCLIGAVAAVVISFKEFSSFEYVVTTILTAIFMF